jgi:hypothetical protein
MATLHVDVDDELYGRLRASAQRSGTTPEVEAARVLDAGVPHPPADRQAVDALIAHLRAMHEEQRARHGVLPDSVPLIRAMRDEA